MRVRSVVVVTALGGVMLSSVAEAKTYTIETYPNRDRCYIAEHIPATVKVNTKGILVRGETQSISGSYTHGSRVVFTENPSVYIQTQKVIEEDHISLVPTSC